MNQISNDSSCLLICIVIYLPCI